MKDHDMRFHDMEIGVDVVHVCMCAYVCMCAEILQMGTEMSVWMHNDVCM